MKACRENRDITPLVLNLGTRWSTSHSGPFSLGKERRCPLNGMYEAQRREEKRREEKRREEKRREEKRREEKGREEKNLFFIPELRLLF